MTDPVIAIEELRRLLAETFVEQFHPESSLRIVKIWRGGAQLQHVFEPNSLRPGRTISGGTMMTLADATMYVAVLASIGWAPLAVTTNLSIHFLRKPQPLTLEGECRLLKLGRRLAVGEISIRTQGEEDLVAHATSTYAIPPA